MVGRWRRRVIKRLDSRRLSYFELRASELPLETLTVFAMCAWPARLPMPDFWGPYSNEFFEPPYTYVLSPEELGDIHTAATSSSMFGDVAHPQLALALVTTERVIWRPLAGHVRGGRGQGRYAVYDDKALAARWLENSCAQFAESIAFDTPYPFPHGFEARQGIRIRCRDACRGCVKGGEWPQFNLGSVASFGMWAEGAEGVMLLVSTRAAVNADAFFRACLEGGIEMATPQATRALREWPRLAGWTPMYERMRSLR